ncbi:MAG: NUDIX domain-containing protein [Promethearchaeota archaeon]
MSYPVKFACHFIGVGGVVFHNAKVLLVKLTYGPTKGKWFIPGGLVNPGETLQEAVTREIYEETGQNIEPFGIIGIRSMVRSTDNLTDLYCIFLCQLESDPKPLFKEEEEIREVRWVTLNELNEDPTVTEYTKKIVEIALHCQPMVLNPNWEKVLKTRLYLKKYEQFWSCD